MPKHRQRAGTGYTLVDDGPVNAWLTKVKKEGCGGEGGGRGRWRGRSVVIGGTVDLLSFRHPFCLAFYS